MRFGKVISCIVTKDSGVIIPVLDPIPESEFGQFLTFLIPKSGFGIDMICNSNSNSGKNGIITPLNEES